MPADLRPVTEAVVASTVFTEPTLSMVGKSEVQARAEFGSDLVVNHGSTEGWVSSRRVGQTHGGYKVLIRPSTGQIVGAHLLGHGSAEAINVLALAMQSHTPASVLATFPFSYPTAVSDLKYMLT